MSTLVVASAAIVLLALTGCSMASATANEVHRDFASTLAATQDLVGGTWQIRDDPVARACTTASGVEGAQIPALRIGTPGADLESAAVVADTWAGLGYTVTTATSSTALGEVAEVHASADGGEYLIFRASAQAMTLQGEGACEPTP